MLVKPGMQSNCEISASVGMQKFSQLRITCLKYYRLLIYPSLILMSHEMDLLFVTYILAVLAEIVKL